MSDVRVGLDIGGTKIHGIAIGPDGVVLAEERVATTRGPEGVVTSAAAVVAALRASLDGDVIRSIGAGIPGIVDTRAGTVKHAVNLGLDGAAFPLAELLGARAGAVVTLENDTNAATLGAHAVEDVDDLVYLSLGTGLAAGLYLGGALRRGFHGAAGEVGHLPVDPEGAVCGCGQRGCLELVASGAALASAWPTTTGHPAAALFAAATEGDPAAIAVRDRFATGVAAAIRALALAVDPERVVIGGGVAAIGEPLREAIAVALTEQAETSPFLASLELASRLRVVSSAPVAAIGAALITPQRTPRTPIRMKD
ncbi:putative NBD/HSP70 family sugar kinase [Nocardioides albertanoniae]|uniref:Putative NBD/HSP70 family sugar kinase n=1 Tax=Nocardioides albertanoniae TaxID=1175486 RepID=A0A543A2B5_9ACTN|nr:ROK family protein [Nocardioides albertanoniae]TQL66727.1 putative NBD/HSP70 family sugar kinase [Nocardioides albertanoniae]